ncbi:MAG: hypothetical protein G3M78_01315 [Candidatus Nitrohelix vancouverensis]|uniref:SnoaL-like domain-containing protein n=1 Tax=Candidatus Nitrohelix vancouverensis TaxID=2705534 RepID=A0A7T0G295_9BACT|nr:MAG: hypothetical protein G3M78_01315 [Candidatus Nitrohelix vancouverensis]
MSTFKSFFVAVLGAGLFLTGASVANAADTNTLADVLKKVDAIVCKKPENLSQFYASEHVILQDHKRALLKHRIEDYRQMISEMRDVKCEIQRTVFTGHVDDRVGYLVVDETSNVTSASTDTEDRQHSICNYAFVKEGGSWKVSLEHCSSMPDYTIRPGEDAHYYYHNPIY